MKEHITAFVCPLNRNSRSRSLSNTRLNHSFEHQILLKCSAEQNQHRRCHTLETSVNTRPSLNQAVKEIHVELSCTPQMLSSMSGVPVAITPLSLWHDIAPPLETHPASAPTYQWSATATLFGDHSPLKQL
eukprot:4936934-Amphidinium_carterae.2